MIVAGLTGSIGTGKSAASACFAKLGAVVSDADWAARKAVAKGSPGWQAIVERWGEGVLDGDGEIDRAKVGDLVFGSDDERKVLNAIVHPLAAQELMRDVLEARKSGAKACILEVPLLFETGFDKFVDKTIVVVASPDVIVKRLADRDGLDSERAMARMRAQMPQEEKAAKADFVVENNGALPELMERVEEVWKQLTGAI